MIKRNHKVIHIFKGPARKASFDDQDNHSDKGFQLASTRNGYPNRKANDLYIFNETSQSFHGLGILSELLIWADDTLNILAAKSIHDPNNAVKASFISFGKFEGDHSISFHFDKFEIILQCPIEYNVEGKSILSKKEGTYLEYTIDRIPRYSAFFWQ